MESGGGIGRDDRYTHHLPREEGVSGRQGRQRVTGVSAGDEEGASA